MQSSTKRLTMLVFISLLSAMSFILQLLDFPLPIFPTFLQIDFSEIPALVAAITYGPLAGVVVEFLKNLLHFLFSGSETGAIPLGQMANFFAGSIFVVITSWMAMKIKGIKGLIFGLITATLTMSILLAIANYYIILPAYSYLINWTVEGAAKLNLVLYAIAPFNFVKGIMVAGLFVPVYWMLKPHLRQRIVV
jgi:riboflavin transporter FmnP